MICKAIVLLTLLASVIVGANAYLCILRMNTRTRHTIRVSYVLLVLGNVLVFCSQGVKLLPVTLTNNAIGFLDGAWLLGVTMLLCGICGLIFFNRRRNTDQPDNTQHIGRPA